MSISQVFRMSAGAFALPARQSRLEVELAGVSVVEKLVNWLGRTVEFAMTGRSEYQLTTSEFQTARTIDGAVQARMAMDELVEDLSSWFHIKLTWPVFLELKHPPGVGWKASLYHAEGNMGRYTPQELGERRGHEVLVAPGLPRPRFRSILAHELVHAYQHEKKILTKNIALREGMARWVEYHVLTRAGAHQEARRLLRIKHYMFGKAIKSVLEHEKNHGLEKTLAWLHEQD